MRPLSACDSDRVSGPSDSGSRSTSGDTGEGEHEVWFQSESHISQNRESACNNIKVLQETLLMIGYLLHCCTVPHRQSVV